MIIRIYVWKARVYVWNSIELITRMYFPLLLSHFIQFGKVFDSLVIQKDMLTNRIPCMLGNHRGS